MFLFLHDEFLGFCGSSRVHVRRSMSKMQSTEVTMLAFPGATNSIIHIHIINISIINVIVIIIIIIIIIIISSSSSSSSSSLIIMSITIIRYAVHQGQDIGLSRRLIIIMMIYVVKSINLITITNSIISSTILNYDYCC